MMSRDKVHVLKIQKRPVQRGQNLASRLPTDLLFLAALGVAFLLAHYSDKPPLVEKPITIQRVDGAHIADNTGIGVRVIDTGLRGFER